MALTQAQQNFIELDKKKAEVKKFYEDYAAATKAVVDEQGVGAYFQDEEGTVYKTDIPAGRFINYEPFEIKRTRRDGEKAGSLSLKEASEAGFPVK